MKKMEKLSGKKFTFSKYGRPKKENKWMEKLRLSPVFVTDYGAKFPITDVPKYGLNCDKQFVGSVTIFVYVSEDAKNLIFVVANTTSKTSYHYHGNYFMEWRGQT